MFGRRPEIFRIRTLDGTLEAQTLSLEAFDAGLDRELAFLERLFLSMPLLHSERSELHARLASIARAIAASQCGRSGLCLDRPSFRRYAKR